MANVQELIISVLQILQVKGSGILAFLKPYFEDLELMFKNGLNTVGFSQNTLHLFLNGDVRKLLVGTKVINNDLLAR